MGLGIGEPQPYLRPNPTFALLRLTLTPSAQAAEASSKWEAAVSRKAQLDVSCLTARGELQRAAKKRELEEKVLSSGGEKLVAARAQLDRWKAQAEEAEAQRGTAAAALEKLRSTHGKLTLPLSPTLTATLSLTANPHLHPQPSP